jgi:hypothetical protein
MLKYSAVKLIWIYAECCYKKAYAGCGMAACTALLGFNQLTRGFQSRALHTADISYGMSTLVVKVSSM